jgi:hypothetical protein
MNKKLIYTMFDYSTVDKDVKSKLIVLAGQVKQAAKDFITAGLAIGEAISEAHELFSGKGRDGQFRRWVELEAGLSKSYAYNWMNAYERSKKCPNFGHFPPSVTQLLAAPSVPDEAVKDVEKAVEKGQKPTVKMVKDTIKKYAPPPNGKPKTAKKPAGESDIDVEDEELNAEAEEDLNFDDRVKQANGRIEHFCRQLVKFYEENCPDIQSINSEGRYDSALAHLRTCCTSLRTCKYYSKPCPKCDGQGCDRCARESDFGGVTEFVYRQLAGY